MIELDPQDEHQRKVSYIEGELARGDRHPDDVKLLRESLLRLSKGIKKFVGRKPTPIAAPDRPTPAPVMKPKPSRAEQIAAQMAEAGRAAVDDHKGDA